MVSHPTAIIQAWCISYRNDPLKKTEYTQTHVFFFLGGGGGGVGGGKEDCEESEMNLKTGQI